MGKKQLPHLGGLVYSTNPDALRQEESTDINTLPPAQQKLMVLLDTRARAGKAVTLVDGFEGKGEDLEILGKQVKNHCGAGGSVKDGQIIVQGDHRDKVVQWLHSKGYTKTRKK
jgi:translation initiation factor 1